MPPSPPPDGKQTRVSSAQLQDSAVWEQIDELLAGLNPEQDVKVLMARLEQLEEKAHSRSVSSGKRKGEILRALFRLLDLKEPRVLLRVLRVMLMVRTAARYRMREGPPSLVSPRDPVPSLSAFRSAPPCRSPRPAPPLQTPASFSSS